MKLQIGFSNTTFLGVTSNLIKATAGVALHSI